MIGGWPYLLPVWKSCTYLVQLPSGVGIELLKQGVAMRDSLDLLSGDSAIIVGNQLLTRDVVTPDQSVSVRTSRNFN